MKKNLDYFLKKLKEKGFTDKEAERFIVEIIKWNAKDIFSLIKNIKQKSNNLSKNRTK